MGCIGLHRTQGLSPIASLSEFPKSSLGSNSPKEPFVIDGYTLRILTAQGDDAPGGASELHGEWENDRRLRQSRQRLSSTPKPES